MLEYPNANIPKDDIVAWKECPWTRPWFNKLAVAEIQGIDCGPHGLYPTRFPVISRPTYNMDGMGAGAELWHGHSDVVYRPGHFWSEVLTGDHTSWDIMLDDGKIALSYCALGHKLSLQHFSHWQIWKASVPTFVKDFVDKHFRGRSGKINIECISDKIIEIHFRWCPEWEHWYDRVPFYSVPLWSDSEWQQLDAAHGEGWEVLPDTGPGITWPQRMAVMLCDDPKIARNHPIYGRYTS